MIRAFAVSSLCLLAVVAGCSKGPAKVKVSGQLVKGKQPLKLGTSVMRTMVFFPYDEAVQDKVRNTYPAMVEEDGSFEVVDIPPGKYVITLELLDAGDLCKGMFKDRDKSKLVREVTGREPLKIDITKPTGE